MSSPADAPPERAARSAELRSALAAAGVPADVEADGALAILRVSHRPRTARPLDAATRAEVVALARACGFTHVAIELSSAEGDADVRRAEPLP
ncbi:hypothetical protein [Gemmatirosa kalamazoonensis]|uniref:hypothetical protein n=1 Tax=Gemmatirosa kalamazoonensis TaxID=861299 RepID=UPI0004B1B0DA|nr:hypothetical protein [Gemmatirosa kalamazoonensis]